MSRKLTHNLDIMTILRITMNSRIHYEESLSDFQKTLSTYNHRNVVEVSQHKADQMGLDDDLVFTD